MNTPSSILTAVSRRLHLQPDHPISITRQLIESRFPDYRYHNTFFPVVSVHQNFDSLGFPADHPGRSRTDTYYINRDTVLRTHTSAHQADTFLANESDGFLISADVYRRDAIDRSHYPVFHQMEGARTWDRTEVPANTTLAQVVWDDVARIPTHNIKVEDPNPTIHPERNPLQASYHTAEEAEAIATHLKRSLENVVVGIFSKARDAAVAAGDTDASSQEPLRVRWVEAYFPFTSPSWELEVFWQGDWLEMLGCGVVKQEIMINAGAPQRLGWAFGVGLERIAMLLFSIPDIRLFWSRDPRFLSQFSSPPPPTQPPSAAPSPEAQTQHAFRITRFAPFSKYPACPRDISFWLPSTSSSAGGRGRMNTHDFHENDIMELVRDVAGDLAEDVRLVDEFVHPKTGRKSLCYRINYRSLERTLTSEEANELHEKIRRRMVDKFGVELR